MHQNKKTATTNNAICTDHSNMDVRIEIDLHLKCHVFISDKSIKIFVTKCMKQLDLRPF